MVTPQPYPRERSPADEETSSKRCSPEFRNKTSAGTLGSLPTGRGTPWAKNKSASPSPSKSATPTPPEVGSTGQAEPESPRSYRKGRSIARKTSDRSENVERATAASKVESETRLHLELCSGDPPWICQITPIPSSTGSSRPNTSLLPRNTLSLAQFCRNWPGSVEMTSVLYIRSR